MSIFVIDDHPLMREAVGTLIRRLSPSKTIIELDRIAVVAQAIQQHGEPEVICLDMKLPDTHGVSGIRELKLRYPHLPMVVLTAMSAVDYKDLAMEAGADAYIEKSATATEISNVLRPFLSADLETDPPATVGKLSQRQ